MFLGIDFGTCYSQSATMYLKRPFLLLKPGEYGIPSEFYYDRDQDILVGQDALDSAMGAYAANLKSQVKMDLAGTFTADGKTFTSKEMISEIFRMLVEQAIFVADTRCISSEIEGVVLSHPAKFTMQECHLLRSAAQDCLGAGKTLKITGMIKEPVAAALSYYHTTLANGTDVLVYDLGGGTCDIAIVRADDRLTSRFDVVDSDMIRVGGRDFDQKLTEYIIAGVEAKSGKKVSEKTDEGIMEKIRRTANSVKHRLSDPLCQSAPARVELGGRLWSVPVSRAEFERITAPLLNETLDCLQKVYDRNGGRKIGEIICVGGSSNMPQVKASITARFPGCNVRVFEPEHAVVGGTAIYAEMLGANPEPETAEVSDFLPFSYGVRSVKDPEEDPNYFIVENIVHRGEKYPACGSRVFYPSTDGITKSVCLRIYESEQQESFPFTDPDKREVGTLELVMPDGGNRRTAILCTVMVKDMSEIEVQAEDDRGNYVEAKFALNALS